MESTQIVYEYVETTVDVLRTAQTAYKVERVVVIISVGDSV